MLIPTFWFGSVKVDSVISSDILNAQRWKDQTPGIPQGSKQPFGFWTLASQYWPDIDFQCILVGVSMGAPHIGSTYIGQYWLYIALQYWPDIDLQCILVGASVPARKSLCIAGLQQEAGGRWPTSNLSQGFLQLWVLYNGLPSSRMGTYQKTKGIQSSLRIWGANI